jgi:flagellar FliJ protein
MVTHGTLTTLLRHAESERDAALVALRQAEAAAAAAAEQADQLEDYRTGYRQRWSTRFREPGAIGLLHCYQGFGQRLDQAIHLQQRHADQFETRLQLAREALLAREQRVAAVRKLIERRQAEQQRVGSQREQRSADEAAQRQASHRPLPFSSP